MSDHEASQSKQEEERWASCAECGDTGLMSALAPCTTFGSDCACNGPTDRSALRVLWVGGGTRVRLLWMFHLAFSFAVIASLVTGNLVGAVLLVAIAVLYVGGGRA